MTTQQPSQLTLDKQLEIFGDCLFTGYVLHDALREAHIYDYQCIKQQFILADKHGYAIYSRHRQLYGYDVAAMQRKYQLSKIQTLQWIAGGFPSDKIVEICNKFTQNVEAQLKQYNFAQIHAKLLRDLLFIHPLTKDKMMESVANDMNLSPDLFKKRYMIKNLDDFVECIGRDKIPGWLQPAKRTHVEIDDYSNGQSNDYSDDETTIEDTER
jgi:hypothetical protein